MINKHFVSIHGHHVQVIKENDLIDVLSKIAQSSHSASLELESGNIEIFRKISMELDIPIFTAVQRKLKEIK